MFTDLTTLLADDMAGLARRGRRDLWLYGLMGLFGLTAYVTGIAALAVYAGEQFGPAVALALIALGAVIVMLATLVWLKLAERGDRRLARRAAVRTELVTSAIGLLPALLKTGGLGTTALVGGAAYLVAREWLKPRRERAEGEAERTSSGDLHGLSRNPQRRADQFSPRLPNGRRPLHTHQPEERPR